MGGARCSYRNCTQRSDNKVTHLFHFPVFDKVRCHQWITNAQKLNYLNLKLSQLKNRVICQHHFTDDCFMNDLKNKLKNTAVPTLNGPLCAVSSDNGEDEVKNVDTELPINIDDIENEFLPNMERKAHFSVKYGDFLTNELPEGITLPNTTSYPLARKKSPSVRRMVVNRFSGNNNFHTFYEDWAVQTNNVKTTVNSTRPKNISNVITTQTEASLCDKKLPDPKVVSIEFEELNLNPTEKDKVLLPDKQDIDPNLMAIFPNHKAKPVSSSVPKKKKVTILSEKHISEPLKISRAELQPVSPSLVINVPHNKKKCNVEINNQEIQTIYLENMNQMPTTNEQLQATNVSNQYTEPMGLNQYVQQITLMDLTGLNNSQDYNNPLIAEVKSIDYFTSNNDENKEKPRQEIVTNVDHNISTEPVIEFVSTSLTGPSIYTVTNMPQISGTITQPNLIYDVSQAQIGDVTSNFAPSTDQVSIVKPFNDTHKQSHSLLIDANEKQLTSKSSSPSKSLVRNKMPPEKLAAIEQKRKYNMKLRDIIHSCLNNMEEEPDVKKLALALKKEVNNKKVGDHLSIVSTQADNTIAYFESRFQRMEDTFLNKLEQHSQKISELKKAIKLNSNKKSVSTQTYQHATATKQNLYQQISQYLSPEANSLLYEELFINDCVLKKGSTNKRRRR